MVIVELLCDHPDCTKERRIIKSVSDVVHAKKMIIAGQIRCPVHGTRSDPLMIGRSDSGRPGSP